MKVKDLIAKLQAIDPDKPIMLQDSEGFDVEPVVEEQYSRVYIFEGAMVD